MVILTAKIPDESVMETKIDEDGNENRASRTSEQGETNKTGFHGGSVVE